MIPEHDNFYTYPLDGIRSPIYVDDHQGTKIFGWASGDQPCEVELRQYPDNHPHTKLNGACYGFVLQGTVATDAGEDSQWLRSGYWFTTANGFRAILSPHTKLFVVQRLGYTGMDVVGKLEPTGRLNYINGAKDSILFGPIKKGDPIINALYMPSGIHQTMHTHPSTRCGVIISGLAQAETRESVHPLEPGMIFYLPTNGWHKFRTDISGQSMTLVAFHPDSDFGPSDEDHPMLNRTMIGDQSAKNLPEIQTKDLDLSPA